MSERKPKILEEVKEGLLTCKQYPSNCIACPYNNESHSHCVNLLIDDVLYFLSKPIMNTVAEIDEELNPREEVDT